MPSFTKSIPAIIYVYIGIFFKFGTLTMCPPDNQDYQYPDQGRNFENWPENQILEFCCSSSKKMSKFFSRTFLLD